MTDEFSGVGGTYIVNAKSKKRQLVAGSRTEYAQPAEATPDDSQDTQDHDRDQG